MNKLWKNKDKREIIKLILSLAIPYGVVAILVMGYNYIRFDSILEFGAKYQLTSNDMGKLRLQNIYHTNWNMALPIQSNANISNISICTPSRQHATLYRILREWMQRNWNILIKYAIIRTILTTIP